jgi:excisionase family DNA binding protein
MDEISEKTLLKPREASTCFNIPVSTIYFWYRTGNIRGVKVNGTCLRIFSKSLHEFLRSRAA